MEEEAEVKVNATVDGHLSFSPATIEILRELFWFVNKGKLNKNKNDDNDDSTPLCIGDAIKSLRREGILFWRDQRFRESQNVALRLAGQDDGSKTEAKEKAEQVAMDFDTFIQFCTPCGSFFLRAFSEELVVPDWSSFVQDMRYLYHMTEPLHEGENAQYIPILRDAESTYWGVSICSIDGQRFSIGDTLVKHTLQSVSKPVTYALGMKREGHEFMDEWIDVEPAGRPFNTQDLDTDSQRPFNASVNSGAIMAAGVYASAFPESTWREVVDEVRKTWYELCGNDLEVGFSQETFESEKATAFINYAITYNLKGRKGLPRDVNLEKMIEVYLGCCSIEITSEALSVAAATLANGGVCPITRKEIFPADVVRSVLAETMMCGMYDQAGRFAVEVGLPAKSGVSGALMVIVPNVFGIATFSPRLNKKGNSVRGVEFAKRLVASYRVHTFEPLRSGNTGAKIDPSNNGWKDERMKISRMSWAVEVGDVHALQLRDVFLYALCQTAFASSSGLSANMLQMIRQSYQQIFKLPVDGKLLQEVQDAVQKYPGELRVLEELTQKVHLGDAMRSLTVMAMLDLIISDGKMSERERDVAIRIAKLIGIDEKVASLELNRHERHAGHHFQKYDHCLMIDMMDDGIIRKDSDLDSSTSKTQHAGRSGQSMASIRREVLHEGVGSEKIRDTMTEEDEIHCLRRENLLLKRKIGALTDLLSS